jgi:hypothetical protein
MSELPKAGEWWLTSWGPVVYIVGRMLGRGVVVQYQDNSTQTINKTGELGTWRRLPDDAGFDWKEKKPSESDLLACVANLRDNMDRLSKRVDQLESAERRERAMGAVQ